VISTTQESVTAPAGFQKPAGTAAREQTRARYPDAEGYVERDGVRIFWERHGDSGPSVLLLPTWSVCHSRFWKMQIPYLARHTRVVTFDGRGNGRSDRPAGAEANSTDEFAADALAVMDATGTERATLVALSCGALRGTILAADHPERVTGIVYIGPAVKLARNHLDRDLYSFDDRLETDEGWAKYNSHYWLKDYLGFLEFFFEKCAPEPHSSKLIEDCVGWGLDTTPEPRADAIRGIGGPRPGALHSS
jgi:pimeloyl-ACP methyl ester carboxylesterase